MDINELASRDDFRLEEDCTLCWYGKNGECTSCGGSRLRLTDFGEKVLELVSRYRQTPEGKWMRRIDQ